MEVSNLLNSNPSDTFFLTYALILLVIVIVLAIFVRRIERKSRFIIGLVLIILGILSFVVAAFLPQDTNPWNSPFHLAGMIGLTFCICGGITIPYSKARTG
jgi:uncharacterized membrane protein YwaF